MAEIPLNFLCVTLIPDTHKETVIQAYLKHVYATFSSSLTVITDNSKEFKNDLLKELAEELGIKLQFLSPY